MELSSILTDIEVSRIVRALKHWKLPVHCSNSAQLFESFIFSPSTTKEQIEAKFTEIKDIKDEQRIEERRSETARKVAKLTGVEKVDFEATSAYIVSLETSLETVRFEDEEAILDWLLMYIKKQKDFPL
jgi:hypothetical protein